MVSNIQANSSNNIPIKPVTSPKVDLNNNTTTSPDKCTNEVTQMPNTSLGKDLIKDEMTLKNLDAIFEKLEGKEGKDFANCAYSEFVKLMGLDEVAPKTITWEKNEGRPIVGDYMFYNNSIVLYSDYFLKQDKATQLGVIAHELTHCKQLVNMLTTEGLSVEKIAYAYAVSDMRAMLSRNPKVQQMFLQAKSNGKEKEFMQMMIKAGTVKTTKELYAAHAETLKLPKHPMNSPEGQKAQRDWMAQYNYNGADMKVYNACPLEKEAMNMENMVKMAYKSRNNK